MALPDSTLQTAITAVVTLVTSLSPRWLIALGAVLAGIGVIRLIPAPAVAAPAPTPPVPPVAVTGSTIVESEPKAK